MKEGNRYFPPWYSNVEWWFFASAILVGALMVFIGFGIGLLLK